MIDSCQDTKLVWALAGSRFQVFMQAYQEGKQVKEWSGWGGKRRVPCLLRIAIFFFFFCSLEDLNQREMPYILCFSYLIHKCIELMPHFQDFFLFLFICRIPILFYVIVFILLLEAPLSLCSPYFYCNSCHLKLFSMCVFVSDLSYVTYFCVHMSSVHVRLSVYYKLITVYYFSFICMFLRLLSVHFIYCFQCCHVNLWWTPDTFCLSAVPQWTSTLPVTHLHHIW